MFSTTMIKQAHETLGLPTDRTSVLAKRDEMMEAFSDRLPSLRMQMQQTWEREHPRHPIPLPSEVLLTIAQRAYNQMQEEILEDFINAPIRDLNERRDRLSELSAAENV